MRVRNGWLYLDERDIDHPEVRSYRTPHGQTRFRAPMKPEVISDVAQIVDIDEPLRHKQVSWSDESGNRQTFERQTDRGADFWHRWAGRLDNIDLLKDKHPRTFDFDIDFRFHPFDHQASALAFSLALPASGLFLETGTGKTYVSLLNAQSRVRRGLVDDVLVICPASIMWTSWVKDARTFSHLDPIIVHPHFNHPPWDCPLCDRESHRLSKSHAKDHWRTLRDLAEAVGGDGPTMRKNTVQEHLEVLAPDGLEWNERRGVAERMAPGYDLYITNPDTVANHTEKFLERGFDMVILDESTMIKNPSANRTQAIHKVGQLSDFRMILTGTPITNNLQDIWSQMYFLDQSMGPSVTEFKRQYLFQPAPQSHPYFYKPQRGARDQVIDRIKDRVIRFTKEECLDLPPRTVIDREVGMSNKAEPHYRTMHDDFYTVLEEGTEVTSQMKLAQMQKLRQITNGFVVDEHEDVHRIDQKPPKLREVRHLLDNELQGKTIIWAFYREDFAYLTDMLEDALVIDKHTSDADIPKIEDKFDQDPDARVLISHPRTAKFGHTWTAATNTIFYSYSFSVEDYAQARDRNYRIGQDRPVTEIFLIGSPIDQHLVDSIRDNQEFGDYIANHDEFRAFWDKLSLN